jgi:hypothetical protein
MTKVSLRLGTCWLATVVVFLLVTIQPAANNLEQRDKSALYGLYYGDWDDQDYSLAIVISPNGKPIPPKANDPDAPTQPGFYVEQNQFAFAETAFSSQVFSFQTKVVSGTSYYFRGRFGHEQVEDISDVPFLQGYLRETKDGKVTREKKVRFVHAVIL